MKRMGIALLGMLFVAAAVFMISLAFTGAKPVSTGQPAGETNPASSVAGATLSSPLPTPTVAATPVEGLAAYRFGKPELIYEEKGPIINDGWLPDNRTLLLSTFPDAYVDDGSAKFEEIKTLDTATGAVQLFGRRYAIYSRRSVWLSDVQEVVYFGAEPPVKDPNTSGYYPNTSIFHLQVATAEKTQALDSPGIGEVRAMTGRNHTVWAVQYDTGALIEIDRQNGEVRKLPVNIKDYGLDPTGGFLQILVHPMLPLLAVFDPNGFLVINSATEEVKQIDLGEDNNTEAYWGKRQAIDAQWNPTREQLALNIGNGEPPFLSTRLFILDASSGKSSQIPVPVRGIQDMAWGPDGVQLLIRSLTNEGAQEYYLVNTQNGSSMRVEGLPEVKYGSTGRAISWSPDGSKLSLSIGNQLFLIPVFKNY